MSLLSNLAGKAAGLNWYKWGAIAVVAVGLFFAGRFTATLECEQEKTEAAEERVVAITRYVTERVTEVQIQEVKSNKELKEIARLREKVDELTNQRPDIPECALSDAEFSATNELLQR